MYTAVTDIALPVVFGASGFLAVATLLLTWRHYVQHYHALQAELAQLAETREFALRMSTVEVRELVPLTRRSRVRTMERAPLPRARRAERVAA